MELAKTLADSLKEVLFDGKWVTGTNIKNEIIDLDWKIATMKIDSLNSIADLTFHIDYYLAGVLNVFEGGELEIKDKYSFDYKPIESQKDWKKLIDKFCYDSEKFVTAVEKMTNKDLERIFVKEEYGNYFRNITVMSEHCYYHLGQIKMIKKLIKQGA
ncbi:DUF1572 family protein [Flavivirga abyssicola]|uniref:DUF1572 family protein n=1 Tax=Flavivirga abyssicola TaxID=3063533 RepID=UPI0026E06204|nr:DUF1572 family protein [Flavivirga sp. MEBiC07777]WVK14261.1 DUF1572 family protein [Flavivirga sp. MEBiC07777]